jgi:transcriptional repressor NrdR
MKCIYCGCEESRVVDSRSTDDGASIRGRRECERCGKRFTTYEKVDTIPLMVVKKDMRREPFDSEKLREGIIKACEKRPVSIEAVNDLTRLEEELARLVQLVENGMMLLGGK